MEPPRTATGKWWPSFVRVVSTQMALALFWSGQPEGSVRKAGREPDTGARSACGRNGRTSRKSVPATRRLRHDQTHNNLPGLALLTRPDYPHKGSSCPLHSIQRPLTLCLLLLGRGLFVIDFHVASGTGDRRDRAGTWSLSLVVFESSKCVVKFLGLTIWDGSQVLAARPRHMFAL